MRLIGHLESSAMAIASAVRAGATIEVVGERLLQGTVQGVWLAYLEVDGVPIPLPDRPQTESPGVRVTWPDGTGWLYLTTNPTRAENLHARALELANQT